MQKNPYKVFIFSIILFLILIMNFQNLTLNQNSSSGTISHIDLSPESIGIKNIPSLSNIPPGNQTNNVQYYKINNNQTFSFTITNQTRGKSILINSTVNDQIAYFKLNNTLSSGNFSIFLIDSNNFDRTSNIEYQSSDYTSLGGTFGMIHFIRSTGWTFKINSSYDFSKGTPGKEFHLQLILYFPNSGANFDNAISAYDYLQVNSPDNYSYINYQVLYPLENLYFKVNLETNRRMNLVINEITPLILDNSNITFYQLDPSSGNPLLLIDQPTSNGHGTYNYSWVSNILYQSNTFWVEIQLNSPLANPGNFSLSFSFQKTGYSFVSATKLSINQTLLYDQNYQDRYSSQNIYFKFKIPYPDVNITFLVKSKNPFVIAGSKFKFFYERSENPTGLTVNEIDSNIRGLITTSFIPLKAGTYYIEYIPAFLPTTGSWSIEISYVKLPTFIWTFNPILFDIFYFLVLPIIVLYIKMRSKTEEIIEWEAEGRSSDVYNTLSKNPRLSPKMEVPSQKILLLRNNILVRDMIIDIVPVRLNAEEKNQTSNFNSSIALRFKNTLDFYLSIGIITWVIVFWFLNVVDFVLRNRTLLPYRVADVSVINNLFYYMLFPVALLILILYFYKEIYVKTTLNEIQSSIDDSSLSKQVTPIKINQLDNENLMKNLAYVRVLWNQAIKAFNEKNYSLFIIRADNSVKKLVETRFQQLLGTIDEKLEFPDIIEAVREQGFDIPSTKKIEYFRKVRNKVVHSSHMLDEKTAIETFTYYSKFLGRLGLRT